MVGWLVAHAVLFCFVFKTVAAVEKLAHVVKKFNNKMANIAEPVCDLSSLQADLNELESRLG